MTLIYSNLSPIAGLVGISDTLVSKRAVLVTTPIQLPLRREPEIYVSNDGKFAASNLRQKSVVFGRTMVQWADSTDYARRAIAAIYHRSQHGRHEVDMRAVVENFSGLTTEQMGDVALIYHFRLDDARLVRSHINCLESQAHGGRLISVGSGNWDITENTVVKGGPKNAIEPDRFITDALSRGISHGLTEINSTDRYGLSYGGWMELSHATADSFTKTPYAIKYWTILEDGNLFANDPLVFSYYVGYDLGICRLFFEGPEFKPLLRYWRIHDFLGRPTNGNRPNGQLFAPLITVHIVRDRRTGVGWFTLRQQEEPSGINYELRDGAPSVTYDDDLTEMIRNYKYEDAPWSIGPNPMYQG